jgi:transposase
MVSEGKKAKGPRHLAAADKLLILAELLPQNRKSAADRFGMVGARRVGKGWRRGVRNGQERRPCLARQIAAEQGISTRNIYRWLALFRAGGAAALADKPRKDKGRCNFLHKRPQWVPVIEERLSAGQTPFKIANDLFRIYGYAAPSNAVCWKFANFLYEVGPGSPSQGRAESRTL